MPSTYSTNLRLELIASGEQANTWGNTTNTNLGTLIESAISGYISLSTMADADYTLIALNGANDQARQMYINVPSGVSLSATRAIIAPSVSKVYVISNNSSGGQAVRIRTSGSTTTCLIPNGQTKTVVCDGTNFSEAVTAIATLTLGGDPTLALQAATKQYVDTADALKLNLTGGTLTGALNLIASTPTGNNATSFNYVNTNYIQKTGSGTQTVDQFLALNYTPSSASHAVNVSYVSTQLANYVPKSGATMTGALTLLSADPSGAWQATPKSWVDTQISDALIDAENYAIANFVPKTRTISAGTTNVSINGVAGGSADLSANVIISVAASATGVTAIAGTTPILVNGASGVPASGNVTVSISPTAFYPYSSATYVPTNGAGATGTWGINISGNAATAVSATSATTATNATNAVNATNATNATNAVSATTATNATNANALGGVAASGYVLKTGSTMTGALNVQNASSPSKYITVNTIYESGNYYPAVSSKNTASTAYADIVLAQENSVGSRLLPLICGPNGNVLIGYLLKLTQLVSGGTTGASIDNDGTLIRTPSDASLKENVSELSGGLSQTLALNPVYYDWIDKQRFGEGRQIGFIAQEVQPIVPEAISHNADATLSLDYAKLTATLTSAIQELNAKVETLQSEVNALKGA